MSNIKDVKQSVAEIREWATNHIDCPEWSRPLILQMMDLMDQIIQQRDNVMNWFGFREHWKAVHEPGSGEVTYGSKKEGDEEKGQED
jgi:hypothetical protein